MGKAVERYQPKAIERLGVNQVQAIANTDLIPPKLRGNVPAIMATILKGRALGLDDMHALTALHWIDGKPTLPAETMVLLSRRAGHSIVGEYGDGKVTARGKRGDTGDEMTVTWTLEMAQRANLLGKDNWKKYPESMLWARAASQLCRMLFADVLAGVGYTPEELERSPEEKVVDGIGDVNPPPDTHAPDDTAPKSEPPAAAGGSDPSDEADVIEGHAVLVDEPDGEPEAAVPSAVSPAASPPAREPGSPSDDPPAPQPAASPRKGSPRARSPEGAGVPRTDSPGQGSIFADMAEKAQERKGAHRDPAA